MKLSILSQLESASTMCAVTVLDLVSDHLGLLQLGRSSDEAKRGEHVRLLQRLFGFVARCLD